MQKSPHYFVANIGDFSYRRWSSARFEAQVLDEQGRGAIVHFFDGEGTYLGSDDKSGHIVIAEDRKAPLPLAVVEAMMKQPFGQGDYVSVDGISVPLFCY